MSAERPHWAVAGRGARVVRGILANLFGLAVKILLQIAQVPIFLSVWSLDSYGEWLLIATLPTYLAASGLGFGTAAANAIAMLSASGREPAVRGVLRAAWLIVTGCCALASAGVIVGAAMIDAGRLFGLREMIGPELVRLVALWCLLVFLRMQMGLGESVFRAIGRYPSFVMVENAAQLAEFVALALALIVWRDAEMVVWAMIAVRVVVLVGLLGYWRRYHGWVLVGPGEPIVPWIRQLFRPSLGFLVLPISQSLSLQGSLLIVGHFFGPAAIPVLATARTLARLIETALAMVYSVTYAEVGYAAGAGDEIALKRMLVVATAASLLIAFGGSAFLLAFGPAIYAVWTHGRVPLDYPVMVAVLAAGVARAFAAPSGAVLIGLNRHSQYSIVLLVSTLVSFVLAIVFARFGLVVVAATPLLIEIAITAYLLPRGLASTGLSFGELLRSLVRRSTYDVLPRLARRG